MCWQIGIKGCHDLTQSERVTICKAWATHWQRGVSDNQTPCTVLRGWLCAKFEHCVGREELEVAQQQYLEQLERYENNHMGNFRRIFPTPGCEKYDKYFHSSGTLFQETAAFRARSELARSVHLFCWELSWAAVQRHCTNVIFFSPPIYKMWWCSIVFYISLCTWMCKGFHQLYGLPGKTEIRQQILKLLSPPVYLTF